MLLYLVDVDQVRKEIVEYDDIVDQIDALQQQLLSEMNMDQIEEINLQIRSLTNQNNGIAYYLKTSIQQLVNKSKKNPSKSIQAEGLKDQFKTAVHKYQSIEVAYNQKCQENVKNQYLEMYPEATPEELKNAVSQMLQNLNSGNQVVLPELGNRDRDEEIQAVMAEMAIRYGNIQQLVKTIEELAQLFYELDTMVAEQEAQVQATEKLINNAHRDIERASEDSFEFASISDHFLSRKWVILGIVMIIIMIVIGIVLGVVCGTGHCYS